MEKINPYYFTNSFIKSALERISKEEMDSKIDENTKYKLQSRIKEIFKDFFKKKGLNKDYSQSISIKLGINNGKVGHINVYGKDGINERLKEIC